MDDALLVGGGEALGDLRGQLDGLAGREGACPETVAQRLALEQFGDQVGRALVGPDVVDDEDVGVVERGSGTGFLLEATHAIGIGRELSRQHLDGHVAPEAGVVRAIDLAHPTRPSRAVTSYGPRRAPGAIGITLPWIARIIPVRERGGLQNLTAWTHGPTDMSRRRRARSGMPHSRCILRSRAR